MKQKRLLLLFVLLAAVTGAWATNYTTLAVGDVIKVGDTFSPTADGAFYNEFGVSSDTTYTLIRADVDNDYNVTEKTDGAFYVFKYASIMSSPYIHFEKDFAVTAISDGLVVTNIEDIKGKQKYILALHESAAPAAAGYTVSLKDGVKDADKWTVKVGEGQAQALPIGGLKGDGSETVTLQYTGRLKVKGVKAVKAAAKPDLLPAVFTVDAGKTVKFSKGNLQATYNGSSWIWGFAEHQWDYIGNAAGNTSINGNGTVSANGTVDLFGWVGASSTWTGAAQYGISNSTATNNVDGYGNVGSEAQKVGWGATVGTGWRTLTRLEWLYLLSERATGVTVNSTDNARYTQATINTDGTAVKGLIIFPDSYAGGSPAGVTWGTINAKSTFETTCTSAGWTALEAAGCVFLPAAGYRQASNVTDAGIGGGYWSSSSSTAPYAFALYFESDYMTIQYGGSRKYGFSVRLVQATSDAEPAKEPATVTTAPKGAAVVGVKKTTALVSGGVADGGTLMYQMTTTNTKPTSTDGFSDAVPTAQTISASGTVYVWYYVKGDDTHSDSEIAATAIEVPVADIVWDATNVSGLELWGTDEYEVDGVKLSGNAENISAGWVDYGDPATLGIVFEPYESGGYTFKAPDGKAFKKIVMKAQSPAGWYEVNLGDGWTFVGDETNCTVTWKDSAASSVELLPDTDDFSGAAPVKSIGFYLSE